VESDDTAMTGDTLRLQVLNNLLQSLKVSTDKEYRSLIISIDLGTTYSGYVVSLEMLNKDGIVTIVDTMT
jgi:uncharacterized protein (DUF2147 family)